MTAAPSRLATEPWRMLFPLGLVLAWVGVSHWLFVWLGWTERLTSAYHAIAQIDGFLWSFVVGFLFTMVPRRTASAPPSRIDLALGFAVPVLTVALTELGLFAVSQTVWLVGCVALLRFVAVRLRRGGRRPPVAFVWIVIALGLSVVGAVATAVGGAIPALHDGHRLGKLLVTQGMVLGLLLGAGSLAIPLLTRGEGPPDAGDDSIPELLGHVAAAFGLVATFVVEVFVDTQAGHALRAAWAALLFVSIAEIHRVPTLPGWNRRVIWAASWCVVLGYAIAALYPARPQLGLHVVFAGGFAPLALAIGMHATLAHGGQQDRLGAWTLRAALPGLGFCGALSFRVLAEVDLEHWIDWLAAASVTFLAATLAWLVNVLPALRAPRAPS